MLKKNVFIYLLPVIALVSSLVANIEQAQAIPAYAFTPPPVWTSFWLGIMEH
jgi:hypothetical protein